MLYSLEATDKFEDEDGSPISSPGLSKSPENPAEHMHTVRVDAVFV